MTSLEEMRRQLRKRFEELKTKEQEKRRIEERRKWVEEIEEEREQQKKAIKAFIDLTLKEYSAKTGYPVPKVEWAPTLMVNFKYVCAGYDHEKKAIIINEDFIRERWARVSGREEVIRSVLAEEFWHSVQDAKGEIPPDISEKPELMKKIEKEARQKAIELSGISEETARYLGLQGLH